MPLKHKKTVNIKKKTNEILKDKKSIGEKLNNFYDELNFNSPIISESLTKKLDKFCVELANTQKNDYCDLKNFNVEDNIKNLEKLKDLREELQKKLNNFDLNGKTNINYSGAAIAGAQVVVEERAATRSITKKLTSELGINEEILLYKALPYRGNELSIAKIIHEQRTDSIVESFVDFQKQLKFKLNVLTHVIKKVENETAKLIVIPERVKRKNTTLENKENLQTKVLRTPENKKQKVDPFDYNKIINECASEMAVDLTNPKKPRKKSLVPIPLDLTNLDEVDLFLNTKTK